MRERECVAHTGQFVQADAPLELKVPDRQKEQVVLAVDDVNRPAVREESASAMSQVMFR